MNKQRSSESALQLLRSFQKPEFHEACVILIELTEGLTKKEIEEQLREKIKCIMRFHNV